MSRRWILLFAAFFAVIVAACSDSPVLTTTAEPVPFEEALPFEEAVPSEETPSTTVDIAEPNAETSATSSENTELREIAGVPRERDGRRADGVEDGWLSASIDISTLQPTEPGHQLAVVEGTSPYFESLSVQALDGCDEQCLELANEFVEAATADPFGETQQDRPPLWRLFQSYCGNCESDFVSIVEAQDGVAQAIEADRAIELFAPIDTETELLITFGRFWLTRPTEAGWEIIELGRPECSDEDTTYRLSTMTFDGHVTEVDTHVVPGSPDDVVCN